MFPHSLSVKRPHASSIIFPLYHMPSFTSAHSRIMHTVGFLPPLNFAASSNRPITIIGFGLAEVNMGIVIPFRQL